MLNFKKKKTPFEIEVLRGDFELAGKRLITHGFRKFGELVISLEDELSYLSNRETSKLKRKILSAYFNLNKPKSNKTQHKKDVTAFSTLEEAMAMLRAEMEKIEPAETSTKREKYEASLNDREAKLLQPITVFRPIPKFDRMGFTHADIIILGKRPNIENALKNFDYMVEGFTYGQVIVRNAMLYGLRSDLFYTLTRRNDPVLEPKVKKGSWKAKVNKKQTPTRYMISDISEALSRSKISYLKIVSDYHLRHEGHVYFLLMPPTLIMLPFCQQVKGRIIPLIDSWGILGL